MNEEWMKKGDGGTKHLITEKHDTKGKSGRDKAHCERCN
jgi:hypothetical protein